MTTKTLPVLTTKWLYVIEHKGDKTLYSYDEKETKKYVNKAPASEYEYFYYRLMKDDNRNIKKQIWEPERYNWDPPKKDI